MQGVNMNGPCCHMQPRQAAVLPDAQASPETGHALALAPYPAGAMLPVMVTDPGWYFSEASPPGISSGASSILRI